MKTSLIALALLCWILGGTAAGEGLPLTKPEPAGFSSERLARIGQVLNAEIEKGRMPGAVVLLARRGHIAYFESFGMRDPATGARMSIWRMKPASTIALYSSWSASDMTCSYSVSVR